MHISILGGNGFLGRKLAARLAHDGVLNGTPVSALTLFDTAPPPAPPGAPFPVHSVVGDLVDLPDAAIPGDCGAVVHLAAVVSAAAEADYELGRRVNARGTDAVVDRCRRLPSPPRLVFTGSVASFSGGQDTVVGDDARQIPANSYGAQKAAAELVLADASRRGFMDAVSVRMPTVIVRPGRPNKAASSFVSGILREPLLGLDTTLPVGDDFAVWVCSPRRAVEWLVAALEMDTGPLGLDRSLNMPGIRLTVGEMLRALDARDPGASRHVHRVDDPAIRAVVEAWPAAFAPRRALALGFAPQEGVDAIVDAFIADDLDATRAERAAQPGASRRES